MFKTCQTNFQTEVLYEQTIRCNLSLPRLAEVTSTLVKMAVFCSLYIEWHDATDVVGYGTNTIKPIFAVTVNAINYE